MARPWIKRSLAVQLRTLTLSSTRFAAPPPVTSASLRPRPLLFLPLHRAFTTTTRLHDWLQPRRQPTSKSRKGRARVPTGGSMRGTTVVWGTYGLRMACHDQRISAAQLKVAEDTIRRRLRGIKYRLYMRICANIDVYKSGNESRMGKGKGGFDHWASRVSVGKVVFELRGEVHEVVVRDAFRLAGNKLPGTWEFIKRGDPPMMGMTKVGGGVTVEELKRPRRKLLAESTAERLPAAVPSAHSVPIVDAAEI